MRGIGAAGEAVAYQVVGARIGREDAIEVGALEIQKDFVDQFLKLDNS